MVGVGDGDFVKIISNYLFINDSIIKEMELFSSEKDMKIKS
jgi:hypothetical protein